MLNFVRAKFIGLIFGLNQNFFIIKYDILKNLKKNLYQRLIIIGAPAGIEPTTSRIFVIITQSENHTTRPWSLNCYIISLNKKF